MASTNPNDTLRTLLDRFEQRRPIRAGSLIVTVYGDAIARRGGSLWLGSLLEQMALFRIGPGLVRTALSRLVADGWFKRSRSGKHSFYRLSQQGVAEFAMAGRKIYRADDGPWDGRLGLAVLTTADPKARLALRETLAGQGYGQLAPNVMLRPLGGLTASDDDNPAEPNDNTIRLVAHVDDGDDADAAARLAQSCWQLDSLGDAYQRFVGDLGPLAGSRQALEQLDDERAFQLRILLIHEYRRIVLRDPLLPCPLLPVDWPGTRAHQICREIYRGTWRAGERWLDRHAVNEKGAIPPSTADGFARFGSA